jgi:hypothetical protein
MQHHTAPDTTAPDTTAPDTTAPDTTAPNADTYWNDQERPDCAKARGLALIAELATMPPDTIDIHCSNAEY